MTAEISAPVIDPGEWPGFERLHLAGPAGRLSVRLAGRASSPAVLFNHSILTSSAIWRRQAQLLFENGYRVICLDTRGHGLSPASKAPYAMDELVADNTAVLDALEIARAHFIGVSLGGMTGLGLGARHSDRLASLCVIAARADAPAAFAAAWDARIALARAESVEALAAPTAERWFGAAFLDSHPEVAANLRRCVAQTSLEGFVGCARAIQGLDYQGELGRITAPVTLVVGERDETLRQPMRDLAREIPAADHVEITDAGHLPQIDRPAAIDALLLRHLSTVDH